MELSVLVRPLGPAGFRASVGGPLPAVADGPTRDAAVANLRAALAEQADGAEVVRLHLPLPGDPAGPVWPDDEFTREWLAAIAANRAAADARPDPWDDGP